MNVSAVSAFLVYYCHKLVLRMYTLYILSLIHISAHSQVTPCRPWNKKIRQVLRG